ncbi:MAG: 1-acyl-sn-glycerol-3-phosphate acyltransferase [Alphaproteobacteria bacterium]|nr:1-acyl-sn-glycerol-3-phosphate acyltransferase [Alphaproteobacteria bacterium]
MDVLTLRAFVKSLVFNIAFFGYCLLASLFFVWTFALPRKQAWAALRYYFIGVTWVERLFLGLDFRVTGQENLPPAGQAYIVAVKHYSAYETLAVPIIFRDVAIILKRELTYIPFWGWYTIKGGMIPVDRGAGGKAIASLVAGGKKAAAEGRPILIFPQGTRVAPTDTTKEKPYKVGIVKIAQALDLPIIPVACNSGAFWPKHSFFKKSGIVDFKILPAIPKGLPPTEALKKLEEVLEPACATLMENAKTGPKYTKNYWPRGVRGGIKLVCWLFVLWAAWWHALAYMAQQGITRAMQQPDMPITSTVQPSIDGFPGTLHITWPQVRYEKDGTVLTTDLLEGRFIPLPAAHGSIEFPNGFSYETPKVESVTIDRMKVGFRMPKVWTPVDTWALDITGIDTTYGATKAMGEGALSIPFRQGAAPDGTLQMRVEGYKELLDILKDREILSEDNTRIASAFFDAMATAQGNAGSISFPFKIVNGVAYAGFVRLFEVIAQQPAGGSAMPPQRNHSGGLGTNGLPAPVSQTPPPPPQP